MYAYYIDYAWIIYCHYCSMVSYLQWEIYQWVSDKHLQVQSTRCLLHILDPDLCRLVSSSASTQPVITTSSSTSLQTSSMHPSSSSTTHPTLFQTSSMHTSSSSTTHPTRTSSYNTLLPLVASAVSIHSSQAGQTGSEPSAVIPSSTNLLTKPTRMSSDKPSFTNLLTKPTRMSSDKPRLSTPVSHTVATLPASSTVVTLIQASNLPTKPEDVCSAIY